MTKRQLELLAPGGDVDSIKAAILAGADAIYCGLDRFNARNRAANISFENLQGLLRLAHQHNCQIFLTLNIIIVESEMPALFTLLNRLANSAIDGVIVQDFGLFLILKEQFPTLDVHASTQFTTHNSGQIEFIKKLGANRFNLSRELSLSEIKPLAELGHSLGMETEVFVHGSNCISFSGICYMSSVSNGNSGNRGRCSQPCRDEFLPTEQGIEYPLNLKDNSAFDNLEELVDAGVDSLKIEGRIKKYHYVHTVVNAWRQQINRYYKSEQQSSDRTDLLTVFNRGFSNTFLTGEINSDMFIDNPRDNSAQQLAIDEDSSSLTEAKQEIYDRRTSIISSVDERINAISIDSISVSLTVSSENGSPLSITVTTPSMQKTIQSDETLRHSKKGYTSELLLKKFKPVNETGHTLESLNADSLVPDLALSSRAFTKLKNSVLAILNGTADFVPEVTKPKIVGAKKSSITPNLSVLISSIEDANIKVSDSTRIYFELPSSLGDQFDTLLAFFLSNPHIVPWFPSVIIGEEYTQAVDFLTQLKPQSIVTNNTGIAFEAFSQEISWIAGPYLNSVNSFSLKNLKENFRCSGAFISNELKLNQIKTIQRPEEFELSYSIYHPQILMTTRQCLFHQTTGCEKTEVDHTCIDHCSKSTIITNVKEQSYHISKTAGNYHTVYSDTPYLNTEILTDLPNFFNNFLIDFRKINTENSVALPWTELITLFEKSITNDSEAIETLTKLIPSGTNAQYRKGI